MQINPEKKPQEKTGFLDLMLDKLEVAGNKLPDPVTLFVIFCVILVIVSDLVAGAGVSVVHPSTKKTVVAVSLLTKEGLQRILSQVVNNFQGFPPLGLVLVVMLGVGVAEKTGLMETAMKQSVTRVPASMVTLVIILAGICGNAAGDAGFIVLPPMAAAIFLAIGRHPLAGMFVAYGSIASGFAANLIVNMSDVLAAGFTIPAAQVVDPKYMASPAMNYYFIVVSTLLLAVTGLFVNSKIVEPRLGKYVPCDDSIPHTEFAPLTPLEIKGLKWSGISVLLYILAVAALSIGAKSFMADPVTDSILAWKAPMMQGIVPLVTGLFLIPGLAYGIITKSITSDKDVVRMMAHAMRDMGGYIVIAFMAAQFLAYFNWSNMGIIIAVKGAEFLKNAGFTGAGLIVGFIILSSFINLFVGSASAKWAIMAPVFVPMFLLVGYDPALTQMAYRIGDSITNSVTPLLPYFPIVVAFAKKYDPKCGMGTIAANMMPYSVSFGIVWILLLVLFMTFNLPLGPDGGIFYQMK